MSENRFSRFEGLYYQAVAISEYIADYLKGYSVKERDTGRKNCVFYLTQSLENTTDLDTTPGGLCVVTM